MIVKRKPKTNKLIKPFKNSDYDPMDNFFTKKDDSSFLCYCKEILKKNKLLK